MSRYDNWLTTTPEDEADAARERDIRRQAADQRAIDDFDCPPQGYAPVRVYAAYRWDPALKRAVPDTVGRIVHPEDYLYDPLRGDR